MKVKGGKREGAGRKPLPEIQRKCTINLFVTNEVVAILGGKETMQLNLTQYALNKAAEIKGEPLV